MPKKSNTLIKTVNAIAPLNYATAVAVNVMTLSNILYFLQQTSIVLSPVEIIFVRILLLLYINTSYNVTKCLLSKNPF